MEQEPLLISTIAVGLTAAFIGGLAARKLRLPPIVGYLLAGVAVGPFTPGFIADQDLAAELAEIGVVLLMFGVGIHFSIRDLLAVRSIAVPGAVGRAIAVTLLAVPLGLALGWGIGGALVLGLALAISSTVVLLRALMDRGELGTAQGRIAIGWLIVEDLLTVAVLVLLPAIAPLLGGVASAEAGPAGPVVELAFAVGKAVLFAVLMLVVGARVVPWLLAVVARERSRELFTLAVLTFAVGIAFASSAVFGVSLALGAFLAGAVLSESDLSHHAAAQSIPLRDAFAVLFFVSIGMLVDPGFLLSHPVEIAAVVVLVVVVKTLVTFAIVAGLGYPARAALTVAAALAQIGEFSFILATLGASLELLPASGFQLIVAGAVISITVNPAILALVAPLDRWLRQAPAARRLLERGGRSLRHLDRESTAAPLAQHTILCGYGRAVRMIAPALERRGFRYVVITDDRRAVEDLRRAGTLALYGDASQPELLEEANVAHARVIVVAVDDPHVTRIVIEQARLLNPRIDVVAETGSDAEAAYLRRAGSHVQPVFGERELAVQMLRYALRRYGLSANEVELIAQGLRQRGGPPAGPGAAERSTWRQRLGQAARRGVDRLRASPSRPAGEPAAPATGAGPATPPAPGHVDPIDG